MVFSTSFGGKYSLAKQQGVMIPMILYYDLWDVVFPFDVFRRSQGNFDRVRGSCLSTVGDRSNSCIYDWVRDNPRKIPSNLHRVP
jgi:hypothetical protein